MFVLLFILQVFWVSMLSSSYSMRIHFSAAFSIVAIYPILVRCSTKKIAYCQADKYISIISFMLYVRYDKFVTICFLSTFGICRSSILSNLERKNVFVFSCRIFPEFRWKKDTFCYNSILSNLPLFSAFWLLQCYWGYCYSQWWRLFQFYSIRFCYFVVSTSFLHHFIVMLRIALSICIVQYRKHFVMLKHFSGNVLSTLKKMSLHSNATQTCWIQQNIGIF